VNGLLFDELTPESIAEGLRQLLADADTACDWAGARRIPAASCQRRSLPATRKCSGRRPPEGGNSLRFPAGKPLMRGPRRIANLCTREKVHKQQSQVVNPLPRAPRKPSQRFSPRYIRPTGTPCGHSERRVTRNMASFL
jgi:hypothetical protein